MPGAISFQNFQTYIKYQKQSSRGAPMKMFEKYAEHLQKNTHAGV